ncbi:hypothetical protein ACXWRS_12550, partial [Streptococcus pyogenes]
MVKSYGTCPFPSFLFLLPFFSFSPLSSLFLFSLFPFLLPLFLPSLPPLPFFSPFLFLFPLSSLLPF